MRRRVSKVTRVCLVAILGAHATGFGAPLEWRAEKGYRWASLRPPPGNAGFTLLAPRDTGIDFSNHIEEDEALNGAGVALGDFDNDGACDIYFTALYGRHRLYRNLGGWKFKDVTAQSGVECEGQFGKGACFVDLNGDRNLDLVVTATADRKKRTGGLRCFTGNGTGKFEETSEPANLASNLGSHTIAVADIDGNGTLDLYVSNAGATDRQEQKRGYYETINRRQIYSWVVYDSHGRVVERVDFPIVGGRILVPPAVEDRFFVDEKGELRELGPPDFLLVGNGRGLFSPASWTDGRFLDADGKRLEKPPLDFGLAATFRDLNGDGAPDIYVCNDFHTPDRLWFGDGKGGFRAAPRLALRSLVFASMGVDIGDLNRDGHADFFVVEMLARNEERRKRQSGSVKPMPLTIGLIDNQPQWTGNALYVNRGDNTWAELAHFAGVVASDWSWQPLFLDIDLDGYEDIFVSNGYARDVLDQDAAREANLISVASPAERRQLTALYPILDVPKVAFRNRGDLTFAENAAAWGLATRGIGHGVAEADLDNDGDLDLVMSMYRGQPAVYRNNSDAPRVAVRLRGEGGNWQGIGAKVTLRGGAVPAQTREVFCGGRYHSGGDPQLCFAAGKRENRMSLEVVWRRGGRSIVEDVRADRIYEIVESPASPE